MVKKSIINRFLEISLNPVPVKKDSKVPIRKDHNSSFSENEIEEYDWKNLDIGISTGFSSMGLEVIDFDLKNTENPKQFMLDFEKQIPTELFNKLVRQSTPSGGFHYIYRSEKIESNQKLARNKKGSAIIETRGIGGYIKCFPSEGYEIVSKNSFDKIPYLTEDERNFLIIISKQKDELILQDHRKRLSDEDKDYLSRFPDYNDNEEIGIGLLEEAGWTFHSENGDWYNMTRPDSLSGELHGGYNREGMFFQVFSTAQDVFEERRGYNNHAIFAELKCEGNYKKAYAKLYEDGWGVQEPQEEGTFKFISSYEEENEYLEQARKGEIPLGVSVGWRALDKHFKLKKNTFYFWLGLDNIGKSTILSSIMCATNILHGFKWGISSPEAIVANTRRTLIEAEAGKPINKILKKEYDILLERSRNNFYIIRNTKHYTIEEILEKGKLLYQKQGIDFLVLDPYSFYSGSGHYTDDVEVLSKIRVFSQKYCSVIVVDHPYSNFTRNEKDINGFLKIPRKYDAAGGSVKANKCDDFICFHRIINHPDPDVRKTVQICVDKVKDKFTGGEPHSDGEWDELIWERRNDFLGYWDAEGNNPMYAAQVSKLGVRAQMKHLSPEEAF